MQAALSSVVNASQHCLKYGRRRVFQARIFRLTTNFLYSVLIRENSVQKKLAFSQVQHFKKILLNYVPTCLRALRAFEARRHIRCIDTQGTQARKARRHERHVIQQTLSRKDKGSFFILVFSFNTSLRKLSKKGNTKEIVAFDSSVKKINIM